jgi:hypothetical protein
MEALITNGAIATDGGSISILGVDAEGGRLHFFLNNRIESYQAGTRS